MRHYYFIIVFSLCMPELLISQNNTDYIIAKEYYNKGDFDKASHLFEKIFKKTKTQDIYNKYLDCLMKIQSYKDAEKLIKTFNKKTKNPSRHVDLGQLYLIKGEVEKGHLQFDLAIEKAKTSDRILSSIGALFYKKRLYNYALKAYSMANENRNNYTFQIANIYSQLGDLKNMYKQLVSLLYNRPNYFQTIKNKLRRTINEDPLNENNKQLKKIILQNIQKNDSFEISKLLVWLFIQEKKNQEALDYEISIDKRFTDNKQAIFDLGEIAQSNKQYATALNCFNYNLKNSRKDSYEYESNLIKKLEIMFLTSTKNTIPNIKEMTNLAKTLKDALSQIGIKSETIYTLKNYCYVLSKCLDKSEDAIRIMEQTINNYILEEYDMAICKMELASLLLDTGQMWEASLLYSQVEKQFKNDIIGQEAKLEKIKINYYNGEFEWAQSQLNILKQSTSKLISNNAMQLSLLIGDNLNLDTTDEALSLYASAQLLYRQKKYKDAIILLDQLKLLFPNHTLLDEVLFQKANISIANNDYMQAISYLNKIETDYYYDILYDDALFKQAILYENIIFDNESALKKYEEILLKAPSSIFISYSRMKYRELRQDNFLMN
jgi:tetratricopeptide (TPR) repeat protein